MDSLIFLAKLVKHITLAPGECLSSYDVSALFSSVPVDPALNIIKDLLEKDHTLKERTVLAASNIILLLRVLSTWTPDFSFQDQFYEQVEGAAMGCPVSPIVANLYMEYLEQKALSTDPNPLGSGAGPCGWQRCHPQGSQQTRLSSTHQQCSPCYKVYSGGQQWGWVYPILGHHCQTWGWWHSIYHSVQETWHIQTSTCSGIVTITSQPNLVSSTPSPIGPKQCVASLSCSNRKRTTSGRLSPNANILKLALDKVEKRLNRSTSEVIDGVNNHRHYSCSTCHQWHSKIRVILSYPTHKVFVKASERSVVGTWHSNPLQRLQDHQEAPGLPQGQRTLWSTKVVPFIGTNVVT